MNKGKKKILAVISVIVVILDCAFDIIVLKMIENRNKED